MLSQSESYKKSNNCQHKTKIFSYIQAINECTFWCAEEARGHLIQQNQEAKQIYGNYGIQKTRDPN